MLCCCLIRQHSNFELYQFSAIYPSTLATNSNCTHTHTRNRIHGHPKLIKLNRRNSIVSSISASRPSVVGCCFDFLLLSSLLCCVFSVEEWQLWCYSLKFTRFFLLVWLSWWIWSFCDASRDLPVCLIFTWLWMGFWTIPMRLLRNLWKKSDFLEYCESHRFGEERGRLYLCFPYVWLCPNSWASINKLLSAPFYQTLTVKCF